MRKSFRILWTILFLSLTTAAYSQDSTHVTTRPKVGLVLSGGGAKGAASCNAQSWNPIFNGPVPAYPTMNNIIGGTEMGRYIDQQLPFIGVNKVSLAFNNIAIARLDIRTRLFKSHYLTAIFNYARSSIDMKNLRQMPPLHRNSYDIYCYNPKGYQPSLPFHNRLWDL